MALGARSACSRFLGGTILRPADSRGHYVDQTVRSSAWKTFWDKGGWWRAILLAVLYMAIYLGACLVIGPIA